MPPLRRLALDEHRHFTLLRDFILLVQHAQFDNHDAPTERFHRFGLFHLAHGMNRVANFHGGFELPFQAHKRNHRAIHHAQLHHQPSRDRQPQQTVRDAFAKWRGFGKLGVGVNRIVIAGDARRNSQCRFQ